MTEKKLKLSRRVPARTHTETAGWCKLDFMEMSQQYRNIRSRARNKMDKCHWCKHKFVDGEMMALAAIEGKENRTLCQECGNQLLASITEEKP